MVACARDAKQQTQISATCLMGLSSTLNTHISSSTWSHLYNIMVIHPVTEDYLPWKAT